LKSGREACRAELVDLKYGENPLQVGEPEGRI